jgi:hypothetical protein
MHHPPRVSADDDRHAERWVDGYDGDSPELEPKVGSTRLAPEIGSTRLASDWAEHIEPERKRLRDDPGEGREAIGGEGRGGEGRGGEGGSERVVRFESFESGAVSVERATSVEIATSVERTESFEGAIAQAHREMRRIEDKAREQAARASRIASQYAEHMQSIGAMPREAVHSPVRSPVHSPVRSPARSPVHSPVHSLEARRAEVAASRRKGRGNLIFLLVPVLSLFLLQQSALRPLLKGKHDGGMKESLWQGLGNAWMSCDGSKAERRAADAIARERALSQALEREKVAATKAAAAAATRERELGERIAAAGWAAGGRVDEVGEGGPSSPSSRERELEERLAATQLQMKERLAAANLAARMAREDAETSMSAASEGGSCDHRPIWQPFRRLRRLFARRE